MLAVVAVVFKIQAQLLEQVVLVAVVLADGEIIQQL